MPAHNNGQMTAQGEFAGQLSVSLHTTAPSAPCCMQPAPKTISGGRRTALRAWLEYGSGIGTASGCNQTIDRVLTSCQVHIRKQSS